MAIPINSIKVTDRHGNVTEIKVGDGATEAILSDSYPYTVTKIFSETRVAVRRDDYRRSDNRGPYTERQDYEYVTLPGNVEDDLIITKRKNGRWYPVGQPMSQGYCFLVGFRAAKRDPHR
jgi:hypothetical protein